MKLNFFANLKFLFWCWFVFLSFWILSAQYYYYDAGWNTYQQWCSENLYVRINMNSASATAWRFHAILDPAKIIYSTSSDSAVLRSNLFNASSDTFANRSALWSPNRKTWSSNTILKIDRSNTVVAYSSDGGLYWTLNFIPLYNSSPFSWSFGMEFNPDLDWCSSTATIETTLSNWWCDVINIWQQQSHLTGTYSFLQAPCIADINSPSININIPAALVKQSRLSGVSLDLNEAWWSAWLSNVPYIWTWWVWTWNPWWSISNQYWIDLNTFNLVISWNGYTKTFTWWSIGVNAVWNGRTWQDYSKNYNLTIDQAQLFDYWIEKAITMTTKINDRVWTHEVTRVITFNQPQAPWLLWNRIPNDGDIFVNLSVPIKLWIQDDRAWVDSWSIKVTLSWINWTNYWPYIFSGISLNLSWATSIALSPDYYINITNHLDFPASWTIRVIVEAKDFANNNDEISDYSFSTRPSCTELQCCENIYVQVGTGTPVLYNYADLYVNYASWLVPEFTAWSITWYLDCRESYYWISVYSGDGNTWVFIDQFTWTQIVFSGTNIKAILTWTSWNVILLIRMWNFIIKVYPSSRSVSDFSNLWEIRFYNQSKVLIYSGGIGTTNLGTWNIIDEIPAWTYYVIYKWQSHLSSYVSWFVVVQNSWLMFLDFTTGTNLYWAQNYSSEEDDWYRYQTAWDFKNKSWYYDFTVNWNDISVLVWSWLIENWIALLDPKNLNWDVALNASDISIIWTNFEKEDAAFFGWASSFLAW